MKKQQKYIIFSIIGLFVVVGGIFLFMRKGADKVSESQEEDVSTMVPAETKTGDSTVDAATASSDKKNETFNTVMTSARAAFLKKDYAKAITLYNEALTYKKHAGAYAGLTEAYSAQSDWVNALKAIDSAIEIFPTNTEYWGWKITILDDQKHASFADLTAVYQTALVKVSPDTKINLVTLFAKVAEKHGQKTEAVGLWEYAQRLYPANTVIYQGEINRLKE